MTTRTCDQLNKKDVVFPDADPNFNGAIDAAYAHARRGFLARLHYAPPSRRASFLVISFAA